jgi:hypothetical protein
MNTKNLQIAIVAVGLSVALAAPAFAQNGPGGQNYGAGSGPQTGGTNYQAPPSTQIGRGIYNTQQPQQNVGSAGPAGPAGANYGAGTGPQTGR